MFYSPAAWAAQDTKTTYDMAMHLLYTLRQWTLKEQISNVDVPSPLWTSLFIDTLRPFCQLLATWVGHGQCQEFATDVPWR